MKVVEQLSQKLNFSFDVGCRGKAIANTEVFGGRWHELRESYGSLITNSFKPPVGLYANIRSDPVGTAGP
jgi:hypothetical protein